MEVVTELSVVPLHNTHYIDSIGTLTGMPAYWICLKWGYRTAYGC